MFDKELLAGKRALVTGGGSGLGLAITKQLLSMGASVTICGRNKEKLLRVKEETGDQPLSVVACNVRDFNSVEAMFSGFSEENFPNVLVNNAAGNFFCCSEDLTPNAFASVVETNLFGSFYCSQKFAEGLIGKGSGGQILNITTTYTDTGSAFILPSACSKAGIAAMTTSLAVEWAEYGIRVNAIAPGPFPTEGAWERLMPSKEMEEQYRKSIPLKRFGDLSELSHLVSFLFSDAAAYMTGEIIRIDGGEKLRGSGFNQLTQLPRSELKKIFQSMKEKSTGRELKASSEEKE